MNKLTKVYNSIKSVPKAPKKGNATETKDNKKDIITKK